MTTSYSLLAVCINSSALEASGVALNASFALRLIYLQLTEGKRSLAELHEMTDEHKETGEKFIFVKNLAAWQYHLIFYNNSLSNIIIWELGACKF